MLEEVSKSIFLIDKISEEEAFELYLSLGAERSVQKVMDLVGERRVSMTTGYEWSSKNNWVERADEYDKRMHEEIMKIALKKAVRVKVDVIEICRAVLARFSQRLLGEEREVMTKKGIIKIVDKYNPSMTDSVLAYRIIKQEIGEGLPNWTGVKEFNLTQIFQQILVDKKSENERTITQQDMDARTDDGSLD